MNTSPLADQMRPKTLEDFVGQEHIVGEGKILHQLLTKQRNNDATIFPSLIFWGPPGTGKTTLARIIANKTESHFVQISAVLAGVKDIREIVKKAKESLQTLYAHKTILFIDEIHRFNKAQQDSLLPHVEDGTLTLIGATTENPSFEVNSALLSRMRVLTLKALEVKHIENILKRAMKLCKAGSCSREQDPALHLESKALEMLIQASNGDARTALNALELAVQLANTGSEHTSSSTKSRVSSREENKRLGNKKSKISLSRGVPDEGGRGVLITKHHITEALQNAHLQYDRAGEEHYNTISAFIKSMRASNPDAALYYLARMVEAGEDAKFIARRMVIFASEDIGMAQPTALVVANEVFRTCETIGYPECAINLAHGVVYLAKAKKDRSSYDAYFKAIDDVKKFGNLPIPFNLRNAPTKLMKDEGYGQGYEQYPDKNKSLLPDKIKGRKYYKVTNG